MDIRRRLPGLLLLAGAAAILLAVPASVMVGQPAADLPWLAGTAVLLASAGVVWRRLPHHQQPGRGHDDVGPLAVDDG